MQESNPDKLRSAETKTNRINFYELAQREMEWNLLAAEGKYARLADAMASNFSVLFGIPYYKLANNIIHSYFIPAIKMHRESDWTNVRKNLASFYSFLQNSSPVLCNFNPNIVAEEETEIWRISDLNISDNKVQKLLVPKYIAFYSEILQLQPDRLQNAAFFKSIATIARRRYKRINNKPYPKIIKMPYREIQLLIMEKHTFDSCRELEKVSYGYTYSFREAEKKLKNSSRST